MSVADVLNILLYNFPHSTFKKNTGVTYLMPWARALSGTGYCACVLLYPEYKAAGFISVRSSPCPDLPSYRTIDPSQSLTSDN